MPQDCSVDSTQSRCGQSDLVFKIEVITVATLPIIISTRTQKGDSYGGTNNEGTVNTIREVLRS